MRIESPLRKDLPDHEVVSIMADLSAHFKIRKVGVRFTDGKGARAHWYDHTWHMIYGRKGYDHFPNGICVIAHEFAHFLNKLNPRFDPKRPHGPEFFADLLRVINVCHEWNLLDKALYPWTCEYGSVYMLAFRKGLTTEKHTFRFKKRK